MKSRFQFRNTLLFLPVLALASVGLYYQRLEKFSDANGSAMFIEDLNLKTATGWQRESGASHTIEVVIDHPWPKPRYWRNCCNIYGGLDSFRKPLHIQRWLRGSKPDDYIANLGEVLWKHDGKTEIIKQNSTSFEGFSSGYKNGRYVFEQPVALQNIGPGGEVIFHGAYIVAGRPALEIRQVLRKGDEVFSFDNSHDTGGKVLSIKPEAWQTIMGTPASTTDDEANVTFHLRLNHPPANETQPGPAIYDLEMIDGKGHHYPNYMRGFSTSWSPPSSDGLPPGEVKSSISADLALHFRPPNPLTLRGKISIDNNWPIPFSVRLPPH